MSDPSILQAVFSPGTLLLGMTFLAADMIVMSLTNWADGDQRKQLGTAALGNVLSVPIGVALIGGMGPTKEAAAAVCLATSLVTVGVWLGVNRDQPLATAVGALIAKVACWMPVFVLFWAIYGSVDRSPHLLLPAQAPAARPAH